MHLHIIKRPVITEKSVSMANRENIYTFEVVKNAHKKQIKNAIEELYSVKVLRVNTLSGYNSLKSTGKKRLKKIITKTKKALVLLKKGDTIELFDLGGQDN